MTRVRSLAPFLVFGSVTLAVFFPVLFQGKTLYPVVAVEKQLGAPVQEPAGWLRPERPHVRVVDALVLLPTIFGVYNEGLKQGEFRLWNPYLFCGTPIYADTMAHPFYPPHLVLHALLSPNAAYHACLLLHLFFGGASMYWLLIGLGRSRPAATAGGLAWMLLGYNSLWFSTGILEGALVFGPLALLALLRSLDRKDLSLAALGGAALGATFLGSHPQHALLLAILVGAWAAFAGRGDPRFAFRAGLVSALFAAGVSMAALLTRLDSIENGYRDPAFDTLTLYEEPWRLATFLAGTLLGKAYYPANPWVEYEFTAYTGLAVFALALVAAVRRWDEPRVRFLALFAAGALAAAFLMPFAWLLTRIPLLNLSPPSRWIFPAGFAVAVLAADGLDSFLERPGRVPRLVGAFSALFGVLCLVGAGEITTANGAALETLIGFALVTAAAFLAARHAPAGLALGLVALLFELLLPFVRYHNWPAHGDVLRQTPEVVQAIRKREKEPWRGTGLLGATPSKAGDYYLSEFMDGNNLLATFGVENPAGFDSIAPSAYARFALTARALLNPVGRAVTFVEPQSRLLDLTNTRYLFFPPNLLPHPRFRKVLETPKVAVYENPDALPRAWLVGRVVGAVDLLDADAKLRNPRFDPRREVVLEGPSPPAGGGTGIVSWVERSSDRQALEVRADAPAFLVVADTHHPGWEAEVDGAPAPVYRANVAFRAVPVPAGTHRVEFRFRPSSARTGLIASAAAAALALVLFAARRLGRRP